MEENRGNGFLWALVGCGALLFLGLCVSAGFGVYVVMRRGASMPPMGQPATSEPSGGSTPVPPVLPPVAPDKPPPTAVAPVAPAVPQDPITVDATITNVSGSLSGRVSRGCHFVVDPPDDRGRCRTQITCDSVLVYGGPTAGYFPCRFDSASRSVNGSDTETTSDDGDAAMTVDTGSRTLQIRDDATGPSGEFSLSATLPATL